MGKGISHWLFSKFARKLQTSKISQDESILWEEIKKITRGFNEEIACGGFSIVYLGKLRNRPPCAVKVVDARSQRARSEFDRECKVLSKVHHQNIIKLIGMSISGEKMLEKKAIVLEYMPNGTLYDNLRSPNSMEWKQRLKVVLQVASALQYLHTNFSPPIIHCDMKSSNVVLDEYLNAKICDFGSARREGETDSAKRDRRASGSSMSSVMMMDSLGYMDPSFLKTGMPSQSKDVYCFGVILAEILTGLEPFSKSRQPNLLSALLCECFYGGREVLDVFDDRIRGTCAVEEVDAVARISVLCLSEDPLKRPSMTEIVQKLGSL